MSAPDREPADREQRVNVYLEADEALWSVLEDLRKEKSRRFRIGKFCEAAISEALPPHEAGRSPDIGPAWVNDWDQRLRCFAAPAELKARVAYYATLFNMTRSQLLCTVIRRKQERDGLVPP